MRDDSNDCINSIYLHNSYPFKKNQQLDYITVSDKEEHFAHSKDCTETFKKLKIYFLFFKHPK